MGDGMNEAYFEPMIGTRYYDTRVLILSESAYSWGEGAEQINPGPSHPTSNLRHWGIDNLRKRGYYTVMGRALCGKKAPSAPELEQAWSNYSYTIFVQGTVGKTWKSRPTKAQWQEAKAQFTSLIENIRPLKVIVTGKTIWRNLPEFTGPERSTDLKAYRLSDGSLVWCLALRHPSRGVRWEELGGSIRSFRSLDLPQRG